MQIYVITGVGKLGAEKGTLVFRDVEEEKTRRIPARTADSLILTSKISVSAQALHVLARCGITLVYAPRNMVECVLIPARAPVQGITHLKQYEAFRTRRVEIAKRIESYGIAHSIQKNSRLPLDPLVPAYLDRISRCVSINELMGVEGNFYADFYQELDGVLPRYLRIKERAYHPPRNRGNAVVSYINALLYSVLLSVLFAAGLDTAVSFIHEPKHGLVSLALDIAEMYRPVVLPRAVLCAVNKYKLAKTEFKREGSAYYLVRSGKVKVSRAFMDQIYRVVRTKRGRTTLINVMKTNALALRRAILENEAPSFVEFRVV